MAPFLRKLDDLLTHALDRGVLDSAVAGTLRDLAATRERERGVLSLGTVLGRLGALVVVLGVVLLVSANWHAIPDAVKIVGFLLLLAGSHAGGLWIRWTDRPYPRTADVLHTIGAGLVIAGVGLIAQTFYLDARPANGVLLWVLAIVPLAFLLRSAPVTGMAVFAFWLWMQMEGLTSGSPLRMRGYAAFVTVSLGLGATLLASQTLLGPKDLAVRRVLRGAGIWLVFYATYMLGFYRHFSELTGQFRSDTGWILPAITVTAGVIGLGTWGNRLVPGSAWLRRRLIWLLVAALVVAAAAVATDLTLLPRGPDIDIFDFGRQRTYSLLTWTVTAAAWVVWFALALWAVAYGTLERNKDYVNIGVVAFGLGVVTRFFDLIGGLAETGYLFVFGGLVLVGTAWGMERWRRHLVQRLAEAAP